MLKILIINDVNGLALPSLHLKTVRCLWSLHVSVWVGGIAESGLLPSCNEADVPGINETVVLFLQKNKHFW